jgi:hypothetical protein
MIEHAHRHPFLQFEPVKHGQGVGKGGRVRGGRARSNYVERITDHVGNDE